MNNETNQAEQREMTIIGAGTSLKGDVCFEGPARILGVVEGSISSNSTLEIGEGAQCSSPVEAATLIIAGQVTGHVIARERLELRATAVVKGEIAAASISVASGASIDGQVSVGVDAIETAAKRRAVRVENKSHGGRATDWISAVAPQADWAARALGAA
jgi:cytoskeletal protein CcmA (bactofilin family)